MQSDLAVASGVGKSTIENIESYFVESVTLRTAKKLAKGLECDVIDLVTPKQRAILDSAIHEVIETLETNAVPKNTLNAARLALNILEYFDNSTDVKLKDWDPEELLRLIKNERQLDSLHEDE